MAAVQRLHKFPSPTIEISTLDIDNYPAVIMVIDGVNMLDPLDPDLITITEDGNTVPRESYPEH